MSSLQKNIVNYIAKVGSKLIIFINALILLLFIILLIIKPANKYLNKIFNGFIADFLVANASNLISLSAIFIGIYFTIFTLISTLNLNSSIAKLSERYFNMLINFIRNAFGFTFIYAIFLLFINKMSEELTTKTSLFISLMNLTNLLLFIYIIVAAARIAILLYAAFSVDIEKLSDLKDSAKKDQEHIELFISDTRNFITRSENNFTKLNCSIKELEDFIEKHKGT
ncbi:hypothetical protein [Rummeliibacillus pycnus]|uniref:hypothetical protein n=1 Tax=Rummeliibacillus pycnus TaxID=101070 RepID=UPI0037C68868